MLLQTTVSRMVSIAPDAVFPFVSCIELHPSPFALEPSTAYPLAHLLGLRRDTELSHENNLALPRTVLSVSLPHVNIPAKPTLSGPKPIKVVNRLRWVDRALRQKYRTFILLVETDRVFAAHLLRFLCNLLFDSIQCFTSHSLISLPIDFFVLVPYFG